MRPGGLEQVQCAVGVDGEIGLRLACGPVVGGLGGGVDDDLDLARVGGEDAFDAVGVADVELVRAKLRVGRPELLGDRRRRGLGAEERLRMSFSIPTTSRPSRIRLRTDSEPIRPPDPVTIATLKRTAFPWSGCS